MELIRKGDGIAGPHGIFFPNTSDPQIVATVLGYARAEPPTANYNPGDVNPYRNVECGVRAARGSLGSWTNHDTFVIFNTGRPELLFCHMHAKCQDWYLIKQPEIRETILASLGRLPEYHTWDILAAITGAYRIGHSIGEDKAAAFEGARIRKAFVENRLRKIKSGPRRTGPHKVWINEKEGANKQYI